MARLGEKFPLRQNFVSLGHFSRGNLVFGKTLIKHFQFLSAVDTVIGQKLNK